MSSHVRILLVSLIAVGCVEEHPNGPGMKEPRAKRESGGSDAGLIDGSNERKSAEMVDGGAGDALSGSSETGGPRAVTDAAATDAAATDAATNDGSNNAPGSRDAATTSTTDDDGGDSKACCTEADCQPESVRSCLCDKWGQSQCCDEGWDTFCQATAQDKCAADDCLSWPETDGGGVIKEPKEPCCAPHASPGCDDAPTQNCICDLLPDCCSVAWDDVCVQLVEEKYCEPDIRTCVCEKWQQSTCCESQWTNVCDVTAEEKCDSPASCP